MMYCIIENGRCVKIVSRIKIVDAWTKLYKKKIKRISKFGDMVKIEVGE